MVIDVEVSLVVVAVGMTDSTESGAAVTVSVTSSSVALVTIAMMASDGVTAMTVASVAAISVAITMSMTMTTVTMTVAVSAVSIAAVATVTVATVTVATMAVATVATIAVTVSVAVTVVRCGVVDGVMDNVGSGSMMIVRSGLVILNNDKWLIVSIATIPVVLLVCLSSLGSECDDAGSKCSLEHFFGFVIILPIFSATLYIHITTELR